MADPTQTRKRWGIGVTVAVAAVVIVLALAGAVAGYYELLPEGWGVEQFVYLAAAIVLPLLVYAFGVGPLSALDGTHAAGEVATLESAEAETKPAVCGVSAEKEAAAEAVEKPHDRRRLDQRAGVEDQAAADAVEKP